MNIHNDIPPRAHNQPISMVCFDAGGVLVRICRSWAQGCEAAGLDVRPARDGSELDLEKLKDLNNRFQRGELSPATFYASAQAALDNVYLASEIERIHQAWILEEYPGVGEIIDHLNQCSGVSTGLLSNTNQAHWDSPFMLASGSTGAVGRIEHPHASHLFGLIKPDQAIFRAFERATGVSAGEILYFDDLLDNVLAAAQAGWQAVHIDHAGDTAAQIWRILQSVGLGLG